MATTPNANDVCLALSDAGLPVPSESFATRKLNAAIGEWEKRTGWSPFLQETSAVDRYVDPAKIPREPITLPTAYVSISEVRVQITPLDDVGVLLTTDQWQTLDYNGPGGLFWIDRLRILTGYRFFNDNFRSVKFKGVRGAVTVWPDDAKDAVVDRAADLVQIHRSGGAGRQLKKIKQGPVTKEYQDANIAERGSSATWAGAFDDVVNYYKRMVVVL